MSTAKARFQLVVVAAGRSRRMGEAQGERKPFLPLAGATVLEHTCRALARSPRVGGIVVVTRADDLDRTDRLLRYVEVHPAPHPDPRGFVQGWNAAAAAVLTRLENDLRVFLEEQGRCDAPAQEGEEAARS